MNDFLGGRRLAKFPDYTPDDELFTITELLKELRRPNRKGVLIHGGPGSGKSDVLKYIAEKLTEDGDVLAVGPIVMNEFRSATDAERILQSVTQRIYHAASSRAPDLPDVRQGFRSQSIDDLLQCIADILSALQRAGIVRLVLLLDDYDKTDSTSAATFSDYLRQIFDQHKRMFGFVLGSATYLEELHHTEHVYSRLRDVTDSHLLRGFFRVEGLRFMQEKAQTLQLSLSGAELEDIFDATAGYPALMNGILKLLASERVSRPEFSVQNAFEVVLKRYYDFEPFHSVCNSIERLVSFGETYSPAQVLDSLRSGPRVLSSDELNSAQQEGVCMLLAMGVLRWIGESQDQTGPPKYTLYWYNPLIQEFWTREGMAGRRHLSSWLRRPMSFSQGALNAQGRVVVCLLMDLDDFVECVPVLGQEISLSHLRSNPKYVQGLKNLGSQMSKEMDGHFQLWEDQEEMYTLACDLNLLRRQVIDESVTPIFEAVVELLKLDFASHLNALPHPISEDIRYKYLADLNQEWARWTRVQVRLTRSGAIAVTLIRDIPDAIPLIDIMNDLVSLEGELSPQGPSGGQEVLSVQWELALAVVAAFMQQAQEALPGTRSPLEQLGLRWKGWKQDGNIYPQQCDRYVIYQFMKLCDCQPGKQGQIIKASNLEPILSDSARKKSDHAWSQAYDFARELTGVLEGVMVVPEERDRATGTFPQIKIKNLREILNAEFSSWEDELFIITLDNALIVFSSLDNLDPAPTKSSAGGRTDASLAGARSTMSQVDSSLVDEKKIICRVCKKEWKKKFGKLFFPGRAVPYESYWQCIGLGLQHLLELRWMVKWLSDHTTQDLGKMADWMQLGVDTRDRREAMRQLDDHVALYTRTLSHLRDATNPLHLASADYAVQKYERFIKISYLRKAIGDSEKDIDAIHAFLERDQDLYEQDRQEKFEKTFTILGVIFAVLSVAMVIPSFWVDFENGSLSKWLLHLPIAPEVRPASTLLWSMIWLIFIALVGLLFYIFRQVKRLNSRK